LASSYVAGAQASEGEGRSAVAIYLAGLVFVAGGVAFFLSARRRELRGLRAPAQVVGREWAGSGEDRAPYPVVEFRTAAGEQVRARTGTGGVLARGRAGQQVQVICDPRNPRNVVIDTLTGRGTIGGPLCVAAGLCLLGLRVFQVIH
jgi:hypothetical protein